MKIYLLIAKRFLFPRNDFRSNTINFISFIGLFIGAAAIVLSVSVLNGFQGILQTEAKKIYGDYLVEDISNTSFLRDLNMDNENYSIFQKNEFLIVSNNKQNLIEFKSVSNESLNDFYELDLQNNFKALSKEEVIIGNLLANRLNVDIGDSIQIISKDFKLNSYSLPDIYEFKVANIFSNRILRANDFLVFGVNKEIFKNANFSAEINGDFNLSSSIMQISSNKIRDLAIFSSIGMKKNDIKKIFIIYSYLIGLSALCGGILFALLVILLQNKLSFIKLSPEFYLVDTLPMQIFIFDIALLLLGSVFLIGIFTNIPLRFINSLSPVKIINKQL